MQVVVLQNDLLEQSKVLQNAPKKHSAILSTFIKLSFSLLDLCLFNFEWPLKTGFTVNTDL